jgi:uncharacterized protein
MESFDSLIEEEIGFYVYALIDPTDKKPFYIGKGQGNRVFAHAAGAVASDMITEKIDRIRSILNQGFKVDHIIIRHGMNNAESFLVESVLIDFLNFNDLKLTNIVAGHKTSAFGVMTVEEIQRKYITPPLNSIGPEFIVININKSYRDAKLAKSFYEATRGTWKIAKWRTGQTKYALSEFRGFIVEVFKIDSWEQMGERWQFSGVVADVSLRSQFLNKRVPKRRGAANPIRYTL